MELPLSVRFSEIDVGGVVYHAHYLPWLEMGRHAYLAALGVPYEKLVREGLHLVVTGINLQYRRPATFPEELRLQTLAQPLGPVRSRFHYRLWRGETLLLEGETQHAWVSKGLRPVALPKVAAPLYATLQEALSRFDTDGFDGQRIESRQLR